MADATVDTSRPAGLKAASVRDVRIDGGFWGERLRINREVTIPAQYELCKSTGRIDAFRLDWTPGRPNEPHIFWDSDVAKWIEAASYSLATHPGPVLDARLDEAIALIASSQQPDGYINSHYSAVEPHNRFTDLRDFHELYCAGHLIEAAVAHFEATGKRNLLEPLMRYADYIGETFGRREGQTRGYCGHQEIELALVRLWKATGEARYLDTAAYFVTERGAQPHYFDIEATKHNIPRGDHFVNDTYEYCQADKPARELDKATGHSVRAMYYYSAIADIADATGDDSLRAACHRLWRDVVERRMYITGALGPRRQNEGFTTAYDLPNDTAYAETCAAIGLVFWAHRMLQMEGDSLYADIMERALFNAIISGISLDGSHYFYENPLACVTDRQRVEWFDCACCPPNLARLMSSLGTYAYSSGSDGVAVHLFMAGDVELTAGGADLRLFVDTDYPWDGAVRLKIALSAPAEFALRLRVPGWCERARIAVNGREVNADQTKGYVAISRKWADGDLVDYAMDMQVVRNYANPRVIADRGRVAISRGPLIYCAEEIDNSAPIDSYLIPRDANFASTFDPKLLGGVVTITGFVVRERIRPDAPLYGKSPPPTESAALKLVPYYAWANRGPGEMQVWMRE